MYLGRTPVSGSGQDDALLERMPLLSSTRELPSTWEARVCQELRPLMAKFTNRPSSLSDYLVLRCASVPLLLMDPIDEHRELAELLLYTDLLFLLERKPAALPLPEELPALLAQLEREYQEVGPELKDFNERVCSFVHLSTLPTDIYAESTGEAHELLKAIKHYNCDPQPSQAREILSQVLSAKTLDPDDRTRLLCFLVHEPNLHLHVLLRKRMNRPCHFLPAKDEKVQLDAAWNAEPALQRLKSAYVRPALDPVNSHYAKVLFEAVKPGLQLKRGCGQTELTVVLNIFTGKITAHTDLIYWSPHKDPSLSSLAETIWRQIQNGSPQLCHERSAGIKQLAEDLQHLLREFGADFPDNHQVRLQGMDPHLFTLKAIKDFIKGRFRPIDGADPHLIASIICQNLLGLVAQSRPMDTQVLGIGADHDGSVTHCHTGNARFYSVHVDASASQRTWERSVRRHAEFLQGPLQSMMSAGQAIKPELVAAFVKGGSLNLAFCGRELDDLLYQTMLATICSDLLPHSLDLWSHKDSGRHRQYSKTIVNGREVLHESKRGCFRENGEAVPYVVYPGTLQPVPFNTPSSEACASTGMLTNPFNPGEHRAAQHGLMAGTPIYERDPHSPRIHRDPDSKGQTLYIDKETHHELKGFMPNNLIKPLTKLSHSCSSFVFLMLHTGYFCAHSVGFEQDMDVIRAQFLPHEPFEDAPIDLTLPYAKVREQFQDCAIELIEAIWSPCLRAPELRERFEEEVLPYLLLAKQGERLSRPELCRIRMLSQLHCLQSEENVQRLGRFINWFFPEPTRDSALKLETLLKEAHGLLRRTKAYQAALQQVKQHFDISPMRTSPGLLLDHFERQRLKLNLKGPVFPRYMSLLSRIVHEALESSRYDPYGYRADPSNIRARLIDVGPKSIGVARRVAQAICTPIHWLARLFSAKAHNRQILTDRVRLGSAKRVCDGAAAPRRNWRSEQVEAFESLAYGRLCDLVEGKEDAQSCINSFAAPLKLHSYEESVVKLREVLTKLSKWKEPFRKALANERHLEQALRILRFRSLTEKSLKKDIEKAYTKLSSERACRSSFSSNAYETVELLREAMLILKTIFLDVHLELCDRTSDQQQESTRNIAYTQMLAVHSDLKEHRLRTVDEWADETPLPHCLREAYTDFHEYYTRAADSVGDKYAIDQLLAQLEPLSKAAERSSPNIPVVDVLDFTLLHVTLLLLDHLAKNEPDLKRLEHCFASPLVRDWCEQLFLLPPEEFLRFCSFTASNHSSAKVAILKSVLQKHPAFPGKPPQSMLVLDYFLTRGT